MILLVLEFTMLYLVHTRFLSFTGDMQKIDIFQQKRIQETSWSQVVPSSVSSLKVVLSLF